VSEFDQIVCVSPVKAARVPRRLSLITEAGSRHGAHTTPSATVGDLVFSLSGALSRIRFSLALNAGRQGPLGLLVYPSLTYLKISVPSATSRDAEIYNGADAARDH
jgi:hypothetical protein